MARVAVSLRLLTSSSPVLSSHAGLVSVAPPSVCVSFADILDVDLCPPGFPASSFVFISLLFLVLAVTLVVGAACYTGFN